MTSRERILATLRGEPVDRPAVNFYEIGGFHIDPENPDPFNIYHDPSWRPLLRLAEEETDLLRMVGMSTVPGTPDPREGLFHHETWEEGGSRYMRTTVEAGRRTLTRLTRRDPDADTVWTLEHLLKDRDDLLAFLELPDEAFAYGDVDVAAMRAVEDAVGDRGAILIDTGDPLVEAALLFDMATYTVIALTEPDLFRRLLDRFAEPIWRRTEQVAAAMPGRLWRVVGAELAVEPYVPPWCFEAYFVPYTGPVIEAIQRHGGYARVHCHGRVKRALPHFHAMGAAAVDPLEPPPQGDVLLADVRREFGHDMVLFGNIEVADIENLPPDRFRKVAEAAVRDGTAGEGRGFVLMPSSCPCGRTITPTAMANYETLVDVVRHPPG